MILHLRNYLSVFISVLYYYNYVLRELQSMTRRENRYSKCFHKRERIW